MYFGLFWFLEISHKAFPYVSISSFSIVLLLISVEVTISFARLCYSIVTNIPIC